MNGLRNLVEQLGPRRLGAMGAVAALLLLGLAWIALREPAPEMGFLYSDLDPAAAQAIAEKLTAQNIPYQLSPDGSSIMAPQDRLAELRMSMAAERLGGKIGYEVLDSEEPFGVSASRARLNETRAIEGELARSIESLANVRAARVHIVMPERAVFSSEPRKATAAITVKTSGRLPAEAVQSIRYLVASSVPELSPEAVSIVDQSGALLARAGEPGAASASGADERQAEIEARLRAQIEALLEPIVGAGKVRAQVAAVIDRDQTREEANVFDPDKQVIARQIMVEAADQNSENDAGAQAASVAAQLPEAGTQPGGEAGESRRSARNENSEDTTYENSRTHTVTIRSPGKITRLTVAVMVDGGAGAMPPAQIQRLTRLVENAVGFDEERGDSVVVESMKFAAPAEVAEAAASWQSMLPSDDALTVLKLVLIAAVGLLALRMLRPQVAMRTVESAGATPRILAPDGTEVPLLTMQKNGEDGDPAALEEGETPPLLDAARPRRLAAPAPSAEVAGLDHDIALAQVDGRIKLSALRRIGGTISGSPAEATSVIRQWMNA